MSGSGRSPSAASRLAVSTSRSGISAGLTLAPGFIDNHVHVLGGGGGLLSSRAPELQTSQLVRAGITSVIGMLGFDATSKDMRALVAKTKAFKEDGISAYALTGATLRAPGADA